MTEPVEKLNRGWKAAPTFNLSHVVRPCGSGFPAAISQDRFNRYSTQPESHYVNVTLVPVEIDLTKMRQLAIIRLSGVFIAVYPCIY